MAAVETLAPVTDPPLPLWFWNGVEERGGFGRGLLGVGGSGIEVAVETDKLAGEITLTSHGSTPRARHRRSTLRH